MIRLGLLDFYLLTLNAGAPSNFQAISSLLAVEAVLTGAGIYHAVATGQTVLPLRLASPAVRLTFL